MSDKQISADPDLMRKDPANWYGPFYFNRKDPGIMVPKMNPAMGGTFNMANPVAILVLAAILAIILLTALYSSLL